MHRTGPEDDTDGNMTREEIVATLLANAGRRVRVMFDDGIVQSVTIDNVDQEGFLHSGPDGTEPKGYWTRFEDVTGIEPEAD
jgi:hypothetical protein